MPVGSPDGRIARLAERQHSVFSSGQARRAGFTRGMINHRLHSGRWRVVHRSVYAIAGAVVGGEGCAMAAVLAAGPGAVASHRTAGALWGLDDVPFPDHPEIIVPSRRKVELCGMCTHSPREFAPPDRTRLGVIPITTPARTLIDLSACLAHVSLERALDSALRRELVVVRSLLRRVRAMRKRGRAGLPQLQRMLEARLGRPSNDSSLETDFDLIFRGADIPRPCPQFVVRDDEGRFIARVDFAYPAARVAIEADSYEHHQGRQMFDRDRDRMARLAAAGWLTIPLTDLHRKDPERARRLLRAALTERSGPGSTRM